MSTAPPKTAENDDTGTSNGGDVKSKPKKKRTEPKKDRIARGMSYVADRARPFLYTAADNSYFIGSLPTGISFPCFQM